MEMISYEEYSDSLDSPQYIDLVKLLKDRFKMPNQEIDKIIDNHFSFSSSIKKNYKNFLDAIEKYLINNNPNQKRTYFQPSLF